MRGEVASEDEPYSRNGERKKKSKEGETRKGVKIQ